MTRSAPLPNVVPSRGGFRLLVLILTILATLNITLASTSPQHLHLNDSQSKSDCQLCFAAHTTTFETPPAQPLVGPAITSLVVSVLPFIGYQTCDGRRLCSRGPPYSSL